MRTSSIKRKEGGMDGWKEGRKERREGGNR